MPFYAVAFGFNPGVFEDWGEAKKSIDGFPQSLYKKFETKEEADSYLKERRPAVVHDTRKDIESKTYYAVARGKEVGVFTDYSLVKKFIADYPQPLHKKFSELNGAVAYFEKFFKGIENKSEKKDDVQNKKKPSKVSDDKNNRPQAFYAVARGHQTGVFSTWDECKQQTTDFKGAKFKKFDNEEDALLFAQGKTLKQIEETKAKKRTSTDANTEDEGEVSKKRPRRGN